MAESAQGAAPQASASLIIDDATVLSRTEAALPGYPELPPDAGGRGAAHFLEHHSVGIAGNRIAWVRPVADVTAIERAAAAEVIDGRGRLAMPGLINTHTHSPMVMFRGAAEDVPTADWFNKHVWPMEVNMTDRDVRLGAELAIGEMLLGGVTSFADHYFGMPEIAGAVEASGARALLAATYFSSEGAAGIDRGVAFAEEWHGGAGGRVQVALGPHGAYTVNDDDLRRTAREASRLGVLTHIHAAENPRQTASSLAKRGVTPIQVLHDTGLLESGVLIAHGAGIVEDDVRWLAPYRDRVGVGSCTKVYLKHAQSGTTPVRLLHDAGVAVGIGTDGAAGHNTLDVFESMRLLAETEKDKLSDATWLTMEHALDLATRQSAAVIGRGAELGALVPGYLADVAVVDLAGPHLQPMHSLAAALVYAVRPSDVEHVIVDGDVVVRDRRLVHLDLSAAISELNERMPALRDTSHGTRIQDYNP
ncbi:amidohydrolase [Gryllotalpicola reticulitermitis]|uniref:Amidohydrolase n=1 Tax=Gryllotalpicola reticulitermitis TaxID=1184153 RepID=A0ABV8Q7Z7_9MICO